MEKKAVIGFLIVLGVLITFFNPLLSGIIAMGIWIYLFKMIRKHKKKNDNTEEILTFSEVFLHRMKVLLTFSAILFLLFIVFSVIHNVAGGADSLIAALIVLWIFVILTVSGLFVFLNASKKYKNPDAQK